MTDSAPYELVVIGAGVNGAAIARELALAGLRVLLLDRGDLGSGTSSASSRLIHGGLRYLEHAELKLVYDSLAERERLLRTAPHLVKPLELAIPVYRGARRAPWQIAVGLALYDVLAVGQSVPRHRTLTREELGARLPGLREDGLVSGATYYDAQITYPERLIVELVRDAVDHGARVETYARVTNVRVEQGAVAGVEWRTRTGELREVAAALVVNAAGPWVDQVLGEIKHTRLIGGTKGSHLVLERFPGAPATALYVEAGADGRPFFILPWNHLYLIGTTDERFDGDPSDARIEQHERQYLLDETERLFPGAGPLAPRVLYTQSGVRPLPHRPRTREAAITRRHLIRRHRSAGGLYSIVGGKLTTHRALAEDVLELLRRRHRPDLPRLSPTRDRRLPGALDAHERSALIGDIGEQLGADQALRLIDRYGAAAFEIAKLAAATPELALTLGAAAERDTAPGRDAAAAGGAAAELSAATGVGERTLVAELVHALEREWAVTLIDILQRRCMRGLDADFGLRAAPLAAQALRRLGLWHAARARAELEAYRELARAAQARAAADAPARPDP